MLENQDQGWSLELRKGWRHTEPPPYHLPPSGWVWVGGSACSHPQAHFWLLCACAASPLPLLYLWLEPGFLLLSGSFAPSSLFPRPLVALNPCLSYLRLEAKEGIESKALGTLAAISDQDPLLCLRNSRTGGLCRHLWKALLLLRLPCLVALGPVHPSALSLPCSLPTLWFPAKCPSPQTLPFSFRASKVTLPIFGPFRWSNLSWHPEVRMRGGHWRKGSQRPQELKSLDRWSLESQVSAKIPWPMAPWPGQCVYTPCLAMRHREARDPVLGGGPRWLSFWQRQTSIIQVIRRDTVYHEAGLFPVLSPSRTWAWVFGSSQAPGTEGCGPPQWGPQLPLCLHDLGYVRPLRGPGEVSSWRVICCWAWFLWGSQNAELCLLNWGSSYERQEEF